MVMLVYRRVPVENFQNLCWMFHPVNAFLVCADHQPFATERLQTCWQSAVQLLLKGGAKTQTLQIRR